MPENKCPLCGDFMEVDCPHVCMARVGARIVGAPEENWRVLVGTTRSLTTGVVHYTVKLQDDPEHMLTEVDLMTTIRAMLGALTMEKQPR